MKRLAMVALVALVAVGCGVPAEKRHAIEADLMRRGAALLDGRPANDPDHVHVTLPDGTSTNFPAK